jgi:hypothetical protein
MTTINTSISKKARATGRLTGPRSPDATSHTVIFVLLSVALMLLASPGPASAATASGWEVDASAGPSNFNSEDTTDQVTELVVSASSGSYALERNSKAGATKAIPWNASPGQLKSAIEEDPAMETSGITVTGGPGDATGSTPYKIVWNGTWSGQSPGGINVVDSSLERLNGKGEAESGTTVLNLVQAAETSDVLKGVFRNRTDHALEGPVTVTDTPPAGLVIDQARVFEPQTGKEAECTIGVQIVCSYPSAVASGHELLLEIKVAVISATVSGVVSNRVEVTSPAAGEDAAATSIVDLNAGEAPFGVSAFNLHVNGENGEEYLQAGGHPYSVTTNIDLNTGFSLSLLNAPILTPVQDVKAVAVELPVGLLGNPTVVPQCAPSELTTSSGTVGIGNFHAACPPDSRVGTVRLEYEHGDHPEPQGFPVYNVVPPRGYPVEFGINAQLSQPIYLYATVVPTPRGYRIRIASPDVLRAVGIEAMSLTIFGDPGEHNESESKAFVSNPTRCGSEPLTAKLEVSSWEGASVNAETTVYPGITGCDLLQGTASFVPQVQVQSDTAQGGAPAGYRVSIESPQGPDDFDDLLTPELRDANIAFPQGVAVNPSAANGLAACQASGPEGINLEATEVGDGYPGGNGSPFEDGLLHPAAGHCPAASTLGTVEVKTPVLSEPLTGHIYLGAPECSPCSNTDAQSGRLVKLYIEAAGSGVIVKLSGTATLDPSTGQLTAHFDENPQFPVENVKVDLDTGPRAALVNPQGCGTYTTTSDLAPWSAPESGPDAAPSSSFAVTEGCGAQGFAPGFTAGTVNPQAGGYSPFTLSLSRKDGEQSINGLQATLPPGLLAKLAGVPRCGNAEASAGTCSEASRIGTVMVGAGAGPDPYYVTGRVYLTGPYNNGPFGEVVEVPAVAGPFNLGTVVVRGSIRINPITSQASVLSDPFPTILDGIPLQVKTVNVTLDRPDFTFNSTSCAPSSVTGTLGSSQGANVNVSSPFEAANCANLPFKPALSASTQGKASKAGGASFTVRVVPGAGQANIARVDLELPKQLPARLTTLQKACTEAQFNTNPADCPAASNIGVARAVTPLLNVPLVGPAYLVSHGGAAFPDVEFILQGEGVMIVLDGKTQIKKGVTYSHFDTVPDAPISSFETVLPEGPYSILATDLPASAKYSLCGTALNTPTTITGQNGMVITQTTKIGVTGCAKKKALSRAQKLAAALRACRTKKGSKRSACEKAARKKDVPVKKAKKKK